MKHSKKKKRPVSHQNRLQTRIIILIVFVVLGAVALNNHRIKIKEQEYAAEEAELDAQIAEAEAEKKDLEEQEEYMKTDAYKEQVAKEEFGMVKDGEYVIKEKKKSQKK